MFVENIKASKSFLIGLFQLLSVLEQCQDNDDSSSRVQSLLMKPLNAQSFHAQKVIVLPSKTVKSISPKKDFFTLIPKAMTFIVQNYQTLKRLPSSPVFNKDQGSSEKINNFKKAFYAYPFCTQLTKTYICFSFTVFLNVYLG